MAYIKLEFCNITFAGTEHGKKLVQLFFESKTFPTQEDIAAQFDKDKTDASRTIRVFVNKIQKTVNRQNK